MQWLSVVLLVGVVFRYGVASTDIEVSLPTEDPALGTKTDHILFHAPYIPQRPELQVTFSDSTVVNSLASGSTLWERSPSISASAAGTDGSKRIALSDNYPPPPEDSEAASLIAGTPSLSNEPPSYETSLAGTDGSQRIELPDYYPQPRGWRRKLRTVMSAVRPIKHRGRPNRLDSLEPFDDLLARLREFLAGSSRVEFDTLGRFLSAEKQDEKLLENTQWDLIQILFSPMCNHRQLVDDVLKTAPLDRLKALLKPLQARYVVGYQFTTRPLYYPITPQKHPQFDQVNVPLYLLRQNEFDASLYFLNALKTNFPGWIRKTQVDITWLVVIDDLLKYSVLRQQNSFVERVFLAIEIAHFYVTSLVTNLFLAIWLDQRDTAAVIYEAITDIPYSGDWFLDSTHDSLYKYFFEPSDEATLACRRVFYKQRRRLLGIPPKIGLWEPSKQPDALKLAKFKNKLLQVIPYRSSVDYQDTRNKYSKQPRYRF